MGHKKNTTTTTTTRSNFNQQLSFRINDSALCQCKKRLQKSTAVTTPQRYLVRVLEVTDPWRVFVCRDLVACLSRCCPAGETRCPPPFDWRSITTAPRHARPQPIDQIVKRARFDRFGSLWPVYKPNTPIKQHHHTTTSDTHKKQKSLACC